MYTPYDRTYPQMRYFIYVAGSEILLQRNLYIRHALQKAVYNICLTTGNDGTDFADDFSGFEDLPGER